jgi:hypothetical protein
MKGTRVLCTIVLSVWVAAATGPLSPVIAARVASFPPPLPAGAPAFQADDPNPPATPVRLVFIHHSTGGNWLADPGDDGPSGGLGIALRDNNYFVSATNYGWGPEGIGDRTDIPNWPEWFTGPNSSAYLNALYKESGQNVGDFGRWSRLPADPGGENEIVMFKSCFPNSDLWGNANDPPASAPDDQLTVSNAKAVYNRLLAYFQTRPDKLFIAITAPPMAQGEYSPDAKSPAERAANARAFNNWLVNDWLDSYPYANVAVFDYYNVLTSNGSANRTDVPEMNEEPNDAGYQDGNHHRWWNGALQHVQTVDNDTSAYPTDSNWDSHPTTAGHRKATAEFVPLLNVYYHRWKSVAAAPRPSPTATTERAEQPTPTPTQGAQDTPTPAQEAQPAPTLAPSTAAGVVDDFEVATEGWWTDSEAGSTIECGLDSDVAHGGVSSLHLRYDVQPGGYADCGQSFEPLPDWSGSTGLSLWLRSEGAGQPLTVMVFSGDPIGPTPFETHLAVGDEWAQFVLPWTGFSLAAWADAGESTGLDPARMIGYVFSIRAQEVSSEGSLWVDDIRLHAGRIEEAVPTATPTASSAGSERTPAEEPASQATDTPAPEATQAVAEGKPSGGICPLSAMVLPAGALGIVLARRQRRVGRRR